MGDFGIATLVDSQFEKHLVVVASSRVNADLQYLYQYKRPLANSTDYICRDCRSTLQRQNGGGAVARMKVAGGRLRADPDVGHACNGLTCAQVVALTTKREMYLSAQMKKVQSKVELGNGRPPKRKKAKYVRLNELVLQAQDELRARLDELQDGHAQREDFFAAMLLHVDKVQYLLGGDAGGEEGEQQAAVEGADAGK